MREPLSLRIVRDYRGSNRGQIAAIAKKYKLSPGRIKSVVDSMLEVAADGKCAAAARRNLARFNRTWSGR